MPDADWPPGEVRSVEVVYEFSGVAGPVVVPASNAELTILELVIEPAPVAEHFVDGVRYIEPPADAKSVRIACRYRVWGADGRPDPFADAPPPEALFPGARVVRHGAIQDD